MVRGGPAAGADLTPGVAAASVLAALGLAVAATALEAVSPAGLDNLSVPLGVTGLYAVLFLPASPFTPALAGLLLSGAVALAALRLGLLTVPGALGAVVVGVLAFVFGGWPLWLLLMWFFGSSNVASKLMRRVRGAHPAEKGGGPRKLRQVLANSVPFLACALAYAATGEAWFLIVSAGALAASTADTWASEVGMYSRKPPVNIDVGDDGMDDLPDDAAEFAAEFAARRAGAAQPAADAEAEPTFETTLLPPKEDAK